MNDFYAPTKSRFGQLEVICGCMFSGKTEALITQIRRAEFARLRFQVFKPVVDTRYSKTDVASHDNSKFPAEQIRDAREILHLVKPYTDIVGVDEVQFLDESIVEIAEILANQGRRVILAGLDTDWQGKPFGPMPQLLAKADAIHKQYAICVVCGAPATKTQRLVPTQSQFLLGSNDSYEARCRQHFDPELPIRMAQSMNKNLDFVSEQQQI
jgi:thymidine kinase